MIELGSQEYRRVVMSLALGSFLLFCNLYLFQPMLPHMATEFAVSETQVNWLFAASTLALSICLVPWAICSESIGRKRIMLLGLLAIPVIGFVMLLTHSLWLLVVTRALMGIAMAAFASVAVAYMVEELSPSAFSQAIGGYIAANSLGGICGRIAGGMLTEAFDWHTAVLCMALFSLAGALLVCWMLPTQRHFAPSTGRLSQHGRVLITHLTNRTLWLAMLIGGANFALFVNLYSVMGFRMVSAPHNLPIGLASLIFICYLSGTISSKLTGQWSKRRAPIPGMVLGAIISMAGMWIALVDVIPLMLLGLVLISFGAFFTHALAYAWVSQKATQAKATASALYLVHYYVGGSLGGFFLIYCWQHGGWWAVSCGGMVFYAMIFLLCYALAKRTQKIAHNAPTSA